MPQATQTELPLLVDRGWLLASQPLPPPPAQESQDPAVPQAGHRLLPAVVHLPLVVPRLLPAVVRLPLVAARLLPVVVRLPLVAFHLLLVAARLLPVVVRLPLVAFHLLLVAARLPLVAPHPLLAGLLPSRVFSLPPLVLLNLPPLGQGRPLLSADQVPRVAPPRPFRWEGLHRPVGHRHRHPILFQQGVLRHLPRCPITSEAGQPL